MHRIGISTLVLAIGLAAQPASAQQSNLLICRDGTATSVSSRAPSCDRHGGVSWDATQRARRSGTTAATTRGVYNGTDNRGVYSGGTNNGVYSGSGNRGVYSGGTGNGVYNGRSNRDVYTNGSANGRRDDDGDDDDNGNNGRGHRKHKKDKKDKKDKNDKQDRKHDGD